MHIMMICPNCKCNMIRTNTGAKKREEHYDSTIYLYQWQCACGEITKGTWNVLQAKPWSISRWLDVNEKEVKALIWGAESPSKARSHPAQG